MCISIYFLIKENIRRGVRPNHILFVVVCKTFKHDTCVPLLANMPLARQALRFVVLDHLRCSTLDWCDKRHFLVTLIGAASALALVIQCFWVVSLLWVCPMTLYSTNGNTVDHVKHNFVIGVVNICTSTFRPFYVGESTNNTNECGMHVST